MLKPPVDFGERKEALEKKYIHAMHSACRKLWPVAWSAASQEASKHWETIDANCWETHVQGRLSLDGNGK